MDIIKKGTIKVPTQPVADNLKVTGIVFKSYDKEIALELHIAKQDGKPADLLGANVRLLMNIYEEVDGVVTKDPVPFITSNLITESYLNGVVKYILPDSLKAYNGTVETFVYVDYPDDSSSDNIGFTFRMEKSKIDEVASEKAEYFIQDFKALLAEVNLQVDEFSADVTELQNEVKAIENEVKSLTKLQTLYSNSLDFGDYDYSGNPNLSAKLNASSFSSGTGATVTDDGDEIVFTLDGTDRLLKYTLGTQTPVTKGRQYTISCEIMLETGFAGDPSGIRLQHAFMPGGIAVLQTDTVPKNELNTWQKLIGTKTIEYNSQTPTSWYPIFRDIRNLKPTGKVRLRNIKIEEGSTATSYQPNLLDAPYYLSKVPLVENIASKSVVFPIKTNAYKIYEGNILEDFSTAKTYTLSMKGTKPASQRFMAYIGGTQLLAQLSPVEGLSDVWSATFTPQNVPPAVPKSLQIYQVPSDTVGECQIDWLKIEKGDTRTPNIEHHRYKGLALLGTTEPTKYEWDYTTAEVDDKVSKISTEPTNAGENASESTLQTSHVVELLRQLTTVEILKLTSENTTFIADGSITFKRIGNVISVYANVKIKNDIASGVAVHTLTQEWKTVATHGLIDGKGTDDTVRQMYITVDDGVTLKTGTPFKQDEWFIGTGDYITDYIKI